MYNKFAAVKQQKLEKNFISRHQPNTSGAE